MMDEEQHYARARSVRLARARNAQKIENRPRDGSTATCDAGSHGPNGQRGLASASGCSRAAEEVGGWLVTVPASRILVGSTWYRRIAGTVGCPDRRGCFLPQLLTLAPPVLSTGGVAAHLTGHLGAVLSARCEELGWIVRQRDDRAVTVTERGRQGFAEAFGLDLER